MRTILQICGLLMLLVGVASAEESDPELAPGGMLAGTAVTGGRGSMGSPWGTDDKFEASAVAPITASITRINDREWQLTVTNNSEDKFRVSLQLEQFANLNRRVKTDHYSYSLNAKQTVQRRVPAHPQSAQAQVKLRKWDRTKSKVSKEYEKVAQETEEYETY